MANFNKPDDNNVISNIVSTSNFPKLDEKTKGIVLGNALEAEKNKAGWLGKFFGANVRNASVNAAIMLTLIFMLAWCVCSYFTLYNNLKFLESLICLIVGYWFGIVK